MRRQARQGGGARRIEEQHARGKLTARLAPCAGGGAGGVAEAKGLTEGANLWRACAGGALAGQLRRSCGGSASFQPDPVRTGCVRSELP